MCTIIYKFKIIKKDIKASKEILINQTLLFQILKGGEMEWQERAQQAQQKKKNKK